MTTKTLKGKVVIESEIEKYREEGNWQKIIELSDLAVRLTKPTLYSFLVGEAKLELYLEQNPPIDRNISKAKIGLSEVKRYLFDAISKEGSKCGVALDGHLLLGKVQYTLGDYEGALKHFEEADLQSLTEKELACRNIKIIAESLAIKGFCMEKQSSNFISTHTVDLIQHCYETSCDLSLVYLQQEDKRISSINSSSTSTGSHSPQPVSIQHPSIGVILEKVIKRAPSFLIENGKLSDAVALCRNLLMAVETTGSHEIRLNLCRELAQIFLCKATGVSYIQPPGLDSKKSSSNPWKPKKFNSLNMFLPRNEFEEEILLLFISEAMAAKNAVLSQSIEFKEARTTAFTNAAMIYDLLTIALIKWKQFSLLQESFERAMKFSSEECHVWMQQALCLDAVGESDRALSIIGEVARLRSNDVTCCLIAARIAYNDFSKTDEGINWSRRALERERENTTNGITSYNCQLLSRCHLYLGIGAHMKAKTLNVKSARDRLNEIAHESFVKACDEDKNDHLARYYLGLDAACKSRVKEAITCVKESLQLHSEHLPSLHLMILLLTAEKRMREARDLLKSTLHDYPDNVILHVLKIHIELHLQGPKAALLVGKRMLSSKTNNRDSNLNDNSGEYKFRHRYTSDFSDRDETNSLYGPQSLAVFRVEQALSEVASSISSSFRKPPSSQPGGWLLQQQIWLLLAEIYLQQDQLDAALSCLNEAVNIFPLSQNIMYMRGLIHEYKREFMEAKQSYQNAVTINPLHLKSLQHLGLMYHYLGNQRIAEKTLRFAAKLDPTCCVTWYNLGKVLESVGEAAAATDCLLTALRMETSSPVLSYYTIPITFE